MGFLKYYKTVLEKVSFNETLLRRELHKAVRHTTCNEQKALLEWCEEVLGEKYRQEAATFMKDKNCGGYNH